MGRKSTKENKTIYQTLREEMDLTREKAGDLMPGLSADRLEKIENGRATIQPEDVLLMAECYKAPGLCNYYCTHECAIGKEHVHEVQEKELAQITVETLNALNKLEREKSRFLEIVEDGEVTPDEYEDFLKIKETLDKMAGSISSLQLWIDETIAEGKINPEAFQK